MSFLKRQEGDPEPLPLGQRLSLRRQMPDSPRAHEDHGWEVCGYAVKKSGKWVGYELRNAAGRRKTAAKCEAVDLEPVSNANPF